MNQRARAYKIGTATVEDIPELLALQAENQINRGGFLSIEFPAAWYEAVVNDMPIVIARCDGRLAGFLERAGCILCRPILGGLHHQYGASGKA